MRTARSPGCWPGKLGAPPSVPDMLAFLTDRWDGKGPLRRARGEQIPLVMRIVHVAVDAAFQRLIGGPEHARDRIAERSGHAFDPDIASCFVKDSADILEPVDEAWAAVLDAEPAPHRWLRDVDLDRGLAAMGRFADLVSPDLTGHSAAVAALAERAAERVGMPPPEVTTVAACRLGTRHRPGRRPCPDLEQAGPTRRGRGRAGTPASVPHRSRAFPERVPGHPGPRGLRAP